MGHAQLWMPSIGEQRPAEIIVSDTAIDLQGCLLTTLNGVPDRCKDTALLIERRTKVELRNAKFVGFKVGIYARNCENLVLDSLTFSDMFRQRLHSTPDREDARDWLWPHNNDNREWMTNYGACIVLENCKNCVIRNCSARGTQNGIILDKCEGCQVYNNDFSYCSGWGCALWRSNKNTVAQNRFDYCVRGYSHGVYARGQDSAGILVFEQCCDNVFAYNSATHGGDGFFLYAGHETTQRTGKGGCNRNLVYGNDFSYAVANGIEATFSDGNVFAKNRLVGCDYGIWAGYSYNTLISQNEIADSLTAGIAIEHGHDNWIEGNTFKNDKIGVWLWWDEDKELTGGVYGKNQNTKSERTTVKRNRFNLNLTDLRIEHTVATKIISNQWTETPDYDGPLGRFLSAVGSMDDTLVEANNFNSYCFPPDEGMIEVAGDQKRISLLANYSPRSVLYFDPQLFEVLDRNWPTDPYAIELTRLDRAIPAPAAPKSATITVSKADSEDRSYIVIDRWGPLVVDDTPKEIVTNSAPSGVHWVALKEVRGIRGAAGGRMGLVTSFVKPISSNVVRLEVRGSSPYVAEYEWKVLLLRKKGDHEESEYFGPITLTGTVCGSKWSTNFWQWTPVMGSDLPPDWDKLVATPPLKTVTKPALEYNIQGGAPEPGVPADHFATVATTEIELPAGSWKLVLTSDDGARLFVDGAKVIERWDIHGPTDDEFTLTLMETRRVKLRVEHFENTGWAALALRIERK